MEREQRILKIVGLLVVVAIVLAGCRAAPAPATATPTQAPTLEPTPVPATPTQAPAFNWKKHAGTSIKVFVADSGQVKFIKPKLADFEALTGITVEFESADATSYRKSLPVQLTAQSGDFDVAATFPEVDGLQFSANGWYEPLDEYINDPKLTNPNFDFGDFPEGTQRAMKVQGKTVTILWEVQTDLLYYRKDILQEHGLEVPKTFDDWLKVAEVVHKPTEEFYAVALRGAGYQMTTPFSAFLFAYCGQWVDANGKAAINSKEALDAFEMYGKLGGKFGPPGIVSFDWQVPMQQFIQGRVATFLDINVFVPTIEDKEKSRVAGKTGYALVPEGPCGRAPFVGGWGWTINPFSKKKEAAWYFIQWATSKELNLEMKLAGWPSPRASAWNSPEFKAKDPTPEFTKVVLESLSIAKAQMNPPVAPGVEAREIVGVVGNRALEGASREELQKLADEQNAKLQALIDKMKK
jgi:multiple sugar transport system substrate-binding protein